MAKFRITSPDQKRLALELEDESGHTVSLGMSPKEAALLAAAVLQLCRELPGEERESSTRRGGDWPVLRPNRISVGPSPLPDCESLVLGFGDANLAVALKRELLKPVGEGLIRMTMPQANR